MDEGLQRQRGQPIFYWTAQGVFEKVDDFAPPSYKLTSRGTDLARQLRAAIREGEIV
jgi:hypothetical protein